MARIPANSEFERPSPQCRLIPGARDVRFGDRHANRGEFTPLTANRARPRHARNLLEDVMGEKFRRGIGVLERRHIVQLQ